jgi:hypothetical protein
MIAKLIISVVENMWKITNIQLLLMIQNITSSVVLCGYEDKRVRDIREPSAEVT